MIHRSSCMIRRTLRCRFHAFARMGLVLIFSMLSITTSQARADGVLCQLRTLIGSYDTPGLAYDIAVVGDTAYVADSFSGLQMMDISDPAAPIFLGSYDTPGSARSVAVVGTIAYVADEYPGLQIIDVSDCPPCLGDFNGDGTLNFFDVSAFLEAFDSNDPAADFTGNGTWNFFDVSAFLQAFAAGCP